MQTSHYPLAYRWGHEQLPGWAEIHSYPWLPIQDLSHGCNIQTCNGTYPTCWVQYTFTATSTTPVANTIDAVCLFYCECEVENFWTVLPTVQDIDITSGSQTVSYNGWGITPNPVMVGQQVKLAASPSPGTNVQWAFDSTAPSSVIGQSFVQNVSTVGTPLPVPSSGTPTSFYWLSPASVIASGSGVRYVRMTESVPGITGPLFADVYYPVGAPSPSVTYGWVNTAVGNVTIGSGPIGCPSPQSTAYELHLGTACGPSPTPGISYSYQVAVPTYGSGKIAVAQLVSITFTGTPNAKYTVGPDLDTQFPYGNLSIPTTSVLYADDSPSYELQVSTCTKLTLSETFQDYLLYQPTSTSRPSIWVTAALGTWMWGGTTTKKSSTNWTLSNPVNPQPTVAPSTTQPAWPQWLLSPAFPC